MLRKGKAAASKPASKGRGKKVTALTTTKPQDVVRTSALHQAFAACASHLPPEMAAATVERALEEAKASTMESIEGKIDQFVEEKFAELIESHVSDTAKSAIDKAKGEVLAKITAQIEELQGKMSALDGTLKSLEAKFETEKAQLLDRAKEAESRLKDVENRLVNLELLNPSKLTLRVDDMEARISDMVVANDLALSKAMSIAEAASSAADAARSTVEQMTLALEGRIKRQEVENDKKQLDHQELIRKQINGLAEDQKGMKKDINRILRMLKDTIKEDLLKLKTKVVEIEKDLKVFKGSVA